MWLSKKKKAEFERNIRDEAFLKSLKDEAAREQWEDIQKMKRDIKKLKKIVRKGY